MPLNKPRLYLVSNMYPSKADKRYGVFVENFSNSIESDFKVKKYVITKHKRVLKKLFAYLVLYIRLFFLPLFLRKTDIIYVHFPLYFSPLVRWWFLFSKNIILNFHGGDVYFDNTLRKILGVFLKPIVKKCKVVVPSDSFSKRVMKLFRIEKSKIHVYPSGGINTLVFKPIKTNKDIFTIGFVSSLIEPKGWRVFLAAINLLKKQNGEPYKVIMVGEGADKTLVEGFIEKHKLPVELLQNRDQKDLATVYNRFHVFVFPTKKESLGLVGLEAMACGVPVIASDVPGPNDYVKHDFNGLLFEENKPQELLKELEYYMVLNEADRQVFIDNSLETIKTFDANIVKLELTKFIID
jgi:glycosyltransferase involved in cell wall biosynthesis